MTRAIQTQTPGSADPGVCRRHKRKLNENNFREGELQIRTCRLPSYRRSCDQAENPQPVGYKQVVGDGLRFHQDRRRTTEVAVAVHVLNRMLELGRPISVRIK
jgi:hypothetical protein